MRKKIGYTFLIIFVIMVFAARNHSSTKKSSDSSDSETQSNKQETVMSEGILETTSESVKEKLILTTESINRQDDNLDSNNNQKSENSNQANNITLLNKVWTEIKGVWYDKYADEMKFFVIDYNEDNKPISYYIWASGKLDDALATDILEIGNAKYKVNFKSSDGAWEWIIDHSNKEELVISDINYDYTEHYVFLSDSIEEAYNKYNTYGNNNSESNNNSIMSSDIISKDEAEEIIRNKMSDAYNVQVIVEYIGESSFAFKDDCYAFSVYHPVVGSDAVKIGQFGILKTTGDIISLTSD